MMEGLRDQFHPLTWCSLSLFSSLFFQECFPQGVHSPRHLSPADSQAMNFAPIKQKDDTHSVSSLGKAAGLFSRDTLYFFSFHLNIRVLREIKEEDKETEEE
eukprot:TRINITY_DN4579_c4_g1_i1.p1 TRINITY_DN4579_c4_g1~~TRINITY_DN4579_c4_g1_i1.p1  ORF type:complete len:102 (-),score=11.79 TRINITY_DN4579_c4_g1_i1:217-522(-)